MTVCWRMVVQWGCIGLAVAGLAACAPTRTRPLPSESAAGYFEPHSHLGGVLPWQAYADLPAFIRHREDRGPAVSEADKLRFYMWLDDTWYPAHRATMDDQPFSSAMRFGLGARATLALHPARADMPVAELDGALTRIFTATPFTEFDSAYAFHAPAADWLATTYYHADARAVGDALCTAGVLALAHQRILRSEQSVSFIGGWEVGADGYSAGLADILCAARRPRELAQAGRLRGDVPRIRVILMTHTDQLGANAAGDAYQTFEHTGRCHFVPLSPHLKLGADAMYAALLGRDANGADIVPADARKDFLDTLVGIDTAAPEMTCFSADGMAYYGKLVDAVYRAAKVRRAHGWHGKLLVHTHVGEGFAAYYARRPPAQPWSFATVFARIPALDGNVITNAEAPRDNIGMLIAAVAEIRRTHPDLDDYVVIRFGHLTHATLQQAQAMARLHIEADINLDSNLATGAWSFAAMPAASRLSRMAARIAADPRSNFQLNDLSDVLVPDPADAAAVAAVFGSHPLKYMLMAHVRVMLGTDGAGVEHASMPREHALAASLIREWQAHDSAFRRATPEAGPETFRANAARHLADMAGDSAAQRPH